MKKLSGCGLVLFALMCSPVYSLDFISKYVENARLLYADNGYQMVQEKMVEITDLKNGSATIDYLLGPGEYFVQLITEPCLKINVGVQTPMGNKQQGTVTEKPEMRSSIAVFNIPESKESTQATTIQLQGTATAYCTSENARLLIYKFVPE